MSTLLNPAQRCKMVPTPRGVQRLQCCCVQAIVDKDADGVAALRQACRIRSELRLEVNPLASQRLPVLSKGFMEKALVISASTEDSRVHKHSFKRRCVLAWTQVDGVVVDDHSVFKYPSASSSNTCPLCCRSLRL